MNGIRFSKLVDPTEPERHLERFLTLSFLPPCRCHDLEVEFSGDFENVRPEILRMKSMSRVFVNENLRIVVFAEKL